MYCTTPTFIFIDYKKKIIKILEYDNLVVYIDFLIIKN